MNVRMGERETLNKIYEIEMKVQTFCDSYVQKERKNLYMQQWKINNRIFYDPQGYKEDVKDCG